MHIQIWVVVIFMPLDERARLCRNFRQLVSLTIKFTILMIPQLKVICRRDQGMLAGLREDKARAQILKLMYYRSVWPVFDCPFTNHPHRDKHAVACKNHTRTLARD